MTAAVAMPVGVIDPATYYDSASYQMVFQVADFLCVAQPSLTLKPVHAKNRSDVIRLDKIDVL